MTPFSQILYAHGREIWESSHRHPFLTELRDGTLPVERFAYYMKQDYVYLMDYAKVFAYGSIKAKDLETMGMFARLLDSTLNTEMELHRQYAARLGITSRDLEETKPAPTTLAYSNYLLDAAATGSLAELAAALLPCMWSYHEIGVSISKHPGALDHPLYREWIETYASQEFGDLAVWCAHLVDRLAEDLPEREQKVLLERFLTASRFEYLFWDMAYRKEEWPV